MILVANLLCGTDKNMTFLADVTFFFAYVEQTFILGWFSGLGAATNVTGRRFASTPGRRAFGHATLSKSCKYVRRQAVLFGTGLRAVTLCGWEVGR